MHQKYRRLLADVAKGYATGLTPRRGTFYELRTNAPCVACAMTAAYVANGGTPSDHPSFVHKLEPFARKQYGIDWVEFDGFLSGFDDFPVGEAIDFHGNPVPRAPEWLEAYHAGKAAADTWIDGVSCRNKG